MHELPSLEASRGHGMGKNQPLMPPMGADEKMVMNQEQHDPETHTLIGLAMAVHNELGHGFLESVYQEAFEIELLAAGVPHQREHPLPVLYKGRNLKGVFKVDFLCFGEVLVELKALPTLDNAAVAQALHYLKSSGCKRSLLINFGAPRLEFKRLVRGY